MKKVLIVQSQIKRYRVPFFNKLRAGLAQDDIALRVAYSDPPLSEAKKGDNQDLPTDYGVKVRASWICRERIIYQPLIREALSADLVIVEQANKFILNYFMLLLSTLGLKRLALWGLADNKQANRSAISEWYKRQTLNSTDWWFAYTEGAARYLVEQGVRPSKITPVQNAVDTHELRETARHFTRAELSATRQNLQIGERDPVGIYCGMIDPVKGLDFLIESARMIRSEIENFHLVIVGGGPQEETMKRDVQGDSWIHCVGPRFGREKILLLKIADAVMAPGRVGLVVLDAFAAGLPLLATKMSIHGPEIEYLRDGYNGLITEHQTSQYARAAADLLSDRVRLRALQTGAAFSGEVHTIENMVERFRKGICSCLSVPKGIVADVPTVRSQERSRL
jgi:glycosyltransferase involved in cell wall biosynthesis